MILDDKQAEAVDTLDQSLLIFASPGGGKTRVLTERLARIIETGRARSDQCLAVTFTNKAAREMKTRLQTILGPHAYNLFCGSFHAVSMMILRHHAEEAGLRNENFTLLQTDEQIDVIVHILTEEAAPGSVISRDIATKIHTRITRWKEKALTPEKVTPEMVAGLKVSKMARRIYPLYQKALAQRNVCDFSDLLLHVITLFENYPDIRKRWNDKFKYVHVDELQDANSQQYTWLQYVVSNQQNICGVGDQKQAIYEWRGAFPDGMISFPTLWPNVKTIHLPSNYRSTYQIITAAQRVVSVGMKTPDKIETRKFGPEVEYNEYRTEREEAQSIAREIKRLIAQGTEPHEIAVLYRTGALIKNMSDALKEEGIDYIVLGGTALIDHEEIRDLLAYLRLANNPYDEIAFTRIVDRPGRGIGNAVAQEAVREAFISENTIADGLRSLAERKKGLSDSKRKSMIAFADLMDELSFLETRGYTVGGVIEFILEHTGYFDWKSLRDPQSSSRLAGLVDDLAKTARAFQGSIQEFLAVLMLADDYEVETAGKVVLSTKHSSKGLEFEIVFCPTMVEGICPHFRSLKNSQDPREERHVVFVSWTRAKTKLYVSYPKLLEFRPTKPSRYLADARLKLKQAA